jgi:oligoribonuclease NrnB/cAMP/cGMP phosphodiesterase (DHH superfamily)
MENKKYALIYHSKDTDGLMSGILMKNYCEAKDIEYDLIGYDYESLIIDLSLYSHLLFCDVSPEFSWVEKNWNDIYNNDIYIEIYDHHKSQSENNFKILKKYEEIGHTLKFDNYSIYDGYTCGCQIFLNNYKDIFKNKYWETIINIITSYDTWTFTENSYLKNNELIKSLDKESIINFYSYLLLFDIDDLEKLMNDRFFSAYIKLESYEIVPFSFKLILKEFITNGDLICKRNDVINKEEIKKGHYSNDIIIFNGTHSANTEKIIEEIYGKVIVSVGVKIDFSINKILFSLRSHDENKFNASNYCKIFGGGGHTGAAGFSLDLNHGFKLLKDDKIIGSITDMIIWK